MPEDRFYNSVLETGENGKQRLENRLNAWPARSINFSPQEMSPSLDETKHNFDLLSSADDDVGYRGIMERMAKNRSGCLGGAVIREPVVQMPVGSAIPVTSLSA